MNKNIIAATALFTMTAVASLVQAATTPIAPNQFAVGISVITFEEGVTTAVPEIPGVLFDNNGPQNFDGMPWFGGPAMFVDTLFGHKAYTNVVGFSYSDLAIDFLTPQQAVGAWVGHIPNFTDTMPAQIIFNAYAGSALISSQVLNLPEGFGAPVFAGVASEAGITRVEWLGGNTGFFGVDNITYGDVVPIPSAAWLFGSGLLGLGRMARTRKVG